MKSLDPLNGKICEKQQYEHPSSRVLDVYTISAIKTSCVMPALLATKLPRPQQLEEIN